MILLQALQQQLKDVETRAEEQIAAAHKEAAGKVAVATTQAATGTERIMAAAADREAALTSALTDARMSMTNMRQAAADKEEVARRQLQQLQDRVRQLEADKEVRGLPGTNTSHTAAGVCVMACLAHIQCALSTRLAIML